MESKEKKNEHVVQTLRSKHLPSESVLDGFGGLNRFSGGTWTLREIEGFSMNYV